MSKFFVHDNQSAPNIAPAHSVYGSPVTATMRPDSHGNGIAPATWSTAPYRPPSRRVRDNPDKKLCAFEGCKSYPSKKAGGDYCAGHARKVGLLPTCGRAECDGAPKGDTKFCHFHQPKMAETADGDAG